jgi:hypothetical protein
MNHQFMVLFFQGIAFSLASPPKKRREKASCLSGRATIGFSKSTEPAPRWEALFSWKPKSLSHCNSQTLTEDIIVSKWGS